MTESWQKVSGLSWTLAKANFKLRTEGSYLGVLWYLLDPVLLFAILIYVFGSNLGASIKFYPLYLIWGLVMFNFFTTVTSQATSVIVNNALFIKSMKIRSEVLVVSILLQTIFSHLFEIIVLVALTVYFGASLLSLLIYLPIFIFFCALTLGISFFLAAFGVYVSDLNNVWKFFTQALFFATPIFYASAKPLILLLNPLASFLAITRGLIIYHEWPGLKIISLSAITSVLALFVGWYLFSLVKNKFAENL
ncbi:MAG: ABC transporter permease [Candidatus Paceibacterota bacterium]|jgi:lipopolysaccharide transport system permease protein